jgi:multiple sugar transport system ATP-binding protein
MASVLLERVSKSFTAGRRGCGGTAALSDVTLAIASGELLVLLGPSGSGKTTLLRLIAGLEELSAGAVSLDGQPMNGVPPQDRSVSMVFQEHSLYPHMTVRENLAFGLKLRKVPKVEAARRTREVAELLRIEVLLDRRPSQLSGGERQRVALGRAIVLRPKVLLLDEPFSSLDAPLRAELRRELAALQRALGTTTLYVTHDQVEAMALADRLAVIASGKIQQVGRPIELYRDPSNVFVAGFLGTPPMNFVAGSVVWEPEAAWFRSKPNESSAGAPMQFKLRGTWPRTGVSEVVLGVRPEHVELAHDRRGADEEEVGISGVIQRLERLGSETDLYVLSGGQPWVARVPSDFAGGAGESVELRLDPGKALLFDRQDGTRVRWDP